MLSFFLKVAAVSWHASPPWGKLSRYSGSNTRLFQEHNRAPACRRAQCAFGSPRQCAALLPLLPLRVEWRRNAPSSSEYMWGNYIVTSFLTSNWFCVRLQVITALPYTFAYDGTKFAECCVLPYRDPVTNEPLVVSHMGLSSTLKKGADSLIWSGYTCPFSTRKNMTLITV